jgi:hypothetical protein
VADTVGFIRELPHELVAAFQSTLTEAREATLLLHVIDASDPRRDERIEQVNACSIRGRRGRDAADPRLQQDRPARGDSAPRARCRRVSPSGVGLREAARLGSTLLLQAIAERLARFARARARCGFPAAGRRAARAPVRRPAPCARKRYRADGTLELVVTLPEVAAAELARTPGVAVLSAGVGPQTCAPAIGYLQSPVAVCAPPEAQLPSHLARFQLWHGTNLAVTARNPWGKRPAKDGRNVDEAFKNFQRKLENLLKGGRGGGRPGGRAAQSEALARTSSTVLAGPCGHRARDLDLHVLLPGRRRPSAAWSSASASSSTIREPGLGWHFWPLEQRHQGQCHQVSSVEYKSRVLTQT